MEEQRQERAFSSPGPALRLLGLALLVAAAQSLHDLWTCLRALAQGGGAASLPGVADLVCGLAAVAAGAFFLRQADENAQALAGGGQVLPPLTLLRLVQTRFEHPLRELWIRSDPAMPSVPMPGSKGFGALWGAGLAIAVPLWAFALVAPFTGRFANAIDAAHHLAILGACAAALHFAALLARRQEEAWEKVKPSVVPAVRVVGRPQHQALAGKAAAPAAGPRPPVVPPQARPPVAQQAAPPPAAPGKTPPPPPAPEPVAPAPPSNCAICNAPLSTRRCDSCGAPAMAASFRVLKALGGSGARRTFLAEAPDGSRVVLKELIIATVPDAQALEAFSREAKMLRELRHPKLPVYVDAFQEEDGPRARLYLAYRYLEGVSLQQELQDRPHTEDQVLDLVEQVLEILRHLHGLQPPLIHRDLKPANLVRRRDGAVALIDFGVARTLERTLNSGTMAGTVGYMPPEQLAGQVDLTCDLYALGATALHLLTRTAPWEFMDGPELRLPPLKTAPVARALLKRMLAPRRARRFSSAREALAALRRLRSGGSRLPRTAVAFGGVAVATAVAVALGADRRIAAQKAPRPDLPAEMPVPAPQHAAPGPTPAPAPPSGALVKWRGGALTADEVKESLRQLPPWLKNDQPWWIQQHVLALVRRKLLVAEAENRGLGSGVIGGADRERSLGAALLEAEARKDADPIPARAMRNAWLRTTGALLAAAEVRFDDAQMFQIEPRKLFGALPFAAPETAMTARLEFMAATGSCLVEVEPALHRYGGRCEGSETLSKALLDPDTLQLLDLSPLPAGFYTRFTDDFVEARKLARGAGLEAAQFAESALQGADLRVAEAGGTLSFSQAQSLLVAVAPALRRCLAVVLQDSPDRALRLKARIRIEVQDHSVGLVRVETEPSVNAALCAQALARPELSGAGELLVVAQFARGAGLPGRIAPPTLVPAPAMPVRHRPPVPPSEEHDDE